MKKEDKDDSLTDFNISPQSNPFTDSVSSIEWMPATPSNPTPPNIFAATTWDGSLRLYEVTPMNGGGVIVEKSVIKVNSPVQNCCWNTDNNTSITLACVDGTVRCADLNSGQVIDVGKHGQSVSNVHFLPGQNAIMSIGYDRMINFWQLGNPNPIFNYQSPSKIYVSDFVNPLFALGTSDQKLVLFDVNNIGNKTEIDSLLQKYSQLQSIAIGLSGDTIGYGSVDGRANLSRVSKNYNGGYKTDTIMTFKANKNEQAGVTTMYPINAVGFNKRNPAWFFTAGSDGVLHIWDFDARNQIKALNFSKTPLTSVKVNPSGELMAYALGNDWHMGPEGANRWSTKIAAHYITDQQMKFAK